MTTHTREIVSNDQEDGGQAQAGKYLTFVLDQEKYALGILKVQEIIALMQITKVPRMPKFVRGIINLRGRIIPVVDLNLKFGIEGKEDTERTCIVVVQLAHGDEEITMGVLVDSVSDVTDIRSEEIEDTPSFGTAVNTEFIQGIGKTDDEVVILLDVEKLFSDHDLAKVQETISVTP